MNALMVYFTIIAKEDKMIVGLWKKKNKTDAKIKDKMGKRRYLTDVLHH